MIAIYFLYGLSFFCLGVVVALQTRQSSELPLIHQLPWLAAFGFSHSLVEWSEMFLLAGPSDPVREALTATRLVMLIFSALMLIRLGVGLIRDGGPLPGWMLIVPPALLVPVGLLTTYALVIMSTAENTATALSVWSRYLLLFPGASLSAWGFIRHRRNIVGTSLGNTYHLLIGVGIAFAIYAVAAGLIVPHAPYGLAPWLNDDAVQTLTDVPVEVGRALIALAVTVLVFRALGIFETERQQQLEALRAERERALAIQQEARQSAEKWIEALVEITRQIASLEPVETTLNHIVEYAREFLGADDAVVALWDEDYENLIIKAHAGTAATSPLGRIISTAFILDAVRARSSNILPQSLEQHCATLGYMVRSSLVAPLAFEQNTFGALFVTSRQPKAFDHAQLDRLVPLSDEAVIAIEHTLMASRLQSLAVVEERSRIAREMHDSLAQILAFLSLEAQTLEVLVRRGDSQAALDELSRARERIDAAQFHVRENILSLRTTLASDAGLIPPLREYVHEFAARTGINAQMVTDLDDGSRQLAPMAQTQLAQIAHEALANVRKHSRAKMVTIRLFTGEGGLNMVITDDGIGFAFDPSRTHFGLQTMRERAESVGGRLEVTSQPGAGTQVTAWMPLIAQ